VARPRREGADACLRTARRADEAAAFDDGADLVGELLAQPPPVGRLRA